MVERTERRVMRKWVACSAAVAACSITVAVLAIQSSAGPLREKSLDRSTAIVPAISPDRDYLTPAEADAAHRAQLLPAGTKSLLKADKPLRHGEFEWNDKDVPTGKIVVWVDLRRQMISVLRGGHEIGTAVVVYGADGMATPTGRFPILSKHRDYHSRAYDAPMPYAMFITKTGVALHGSPMSSRHATHGCVGLPIEFARLLFAVAKPGDEVGVFNSDPTVARQFVATFIS
ncbi:L,D-transpeptidase family protein [Sphingopyxis sp. H050]|jgi:lipoprotein-anchoring transpeptidase ErfK/SrfK|uniref:L,D-transpeptidase family protein n=1 Tax=Sphingopyxis sp. H050 TaxID=1759072 RepID=UPI0018D24F76|nr:L,D-transpeptidase family protein [Sphingopyxis sp. H050]